MKVEKADINSIFDGIGEVLTFLGIRLRLSCIDKFEKNAMPPSYSISGQYQSTRTTDVEGWVLPLSVLS